MNVYQYLISEGYIPICLDEIHRLSLENNWTTVYDNVKSELYKKIESARNKETIDKYNRTSLSKKPKYNPEELFISGKNVLKYFIFSVIKGNAKPGAVIYDDDKEIGYVIRSEFKY